MLRFNFKFDWLGWLGLALLLVDLDGLGLTLIVTAS